MLNSNYIFNSKFRFKMFHDFEPVSVRNKTYTEWAGETLQECIMQDDPQCILKDGEQVDHQIVRMCYYIFYIYIDHYLDFQSYFCGQHPECVSFNSGLALQRAKSNIERLYPVVAILERFKESMIMAQKKYRNVFPNLLKRYYQSKLHSVIINWETTQKNCGILCLQ